MRDSENSVVDVGSTQDPARGNGHPDPYAVAFVGRAEELARSTVTLVRRSDVHGSYREHESGEVRGTTPKEPLSEARLVRHFHGDGAPVGAHLLDSQDSVEWFAFDLDRHPRADGAFDRPRQDVLDDALTINYGLVARDFHPVLEQSCPNGSCKVWVFLDEPLAAATCRAFAQSFLHGFEPEPEFFPKQDSAWKTNKDTGKLELGCGNWARFPGRHHRYRDYWSRFWDPEISDWADPETNVTIWLNRQDSSSALVTDLAQRHAVRPSPSVPPQDPQPSAVAGRETTDPESIRHRIDSYIAAIVGRTRGRGAGTGRADVLFTVAAKLAVDWALPDEFTMDCLRAVNDGFGAQYPEAKLRDTIANAHRYGRGAYGNDLAPSSPGITGEGPGEAAPSPAPPERPKIPAEFLAADRGYRDLMDDATVRPDAVLGDGLLYPRQIGQLHGTDGSRKSFALLCLVIAAATGMEWFGLRTRPGGMRVGLISLEDDVWTLKARIAAIVKAMGADEVLLEQNLRLIYPPYFDHRLDLRNSDHRAAIVSWIKSHRLELVVVDHLSRTHDLDPRELHLASAEALSIARECTCAIVFAHHDRKKAQGTRGRDTDASLGSALFRADCRLSMHVFEVEDDLLCLLFEKSTGRRKPDPIWLRQSEEKGGALDVTTPPKKATDKKKTNKARLLDLIREAGPSGLPPRSLEGQFEVAMDTLSNYAREMEVNGLIRRTGRTDSTRWVALELPGDKTQPEDARQSA